MLLDTRFLLQLQAKLTKDIDLKSAAAPLQFSRGYALPNGTGSGQADLIWDDRRTIAASGTDDLDLAGTLTDIYGATVTFARIKAIVVAAAAGNANNVVIGAAATNQFVGPFGSATHTCHVRPGGVAAFVATDATGWPVTAGTGDLLRIANSGAGTSVTYDIVLLGASA